MMHFERVPKYEASIQRNPWILEVETQMIKMYILC